MTRNSKTRAFIWMTAALGCMVALFSLSAEARTFDFKTEHFAPYVGGTYGYSQVGDSAFGSSSGVGTTTDQKISANASGEAGFIIAMTRFNLKLGVDFIVPRWLSGINGTNAAGTNLFSLDSDVYAVVPMANIEYLMRQTSESHAIFGVGFGMAFLTLDNTYTMTPAGTAALGVGNTEEKGRGTAPAAQAYVGYEILITDTATIAVEAGYRYIQVLTINSTETLKAPSGSETTGQPLNNNGNENRSINLSGPFVGLSLRFYIGG